MPPKKDGRDEAVTMKDLGDVKSKADWIVKKVEAYIISGHKNTTIVNIMTDSQMNSDRNPAADEMLAVMVHAIADLIRGRIEVRKPWRERSPT